MVGLVKLLINRFFFKCAFKNAAVRLHFSAWFISLAIQIVYFKSKPLSIKLKKKIFVPDIAVMSCTVPVSSRALNN